MTTQFLLWPQVTEIASEVLRNSAQGQGRYRCTVLARPSLAQFSALTPRPEPLDDVAGRYWLEKGQHYAAHRNIWKRLALLVEFFGKDKLISDIADDDVAKLVAWRRGHCTRGGGLPGAGRARHRQHDHHAVEDVVRHAAAPGAGAGVAQALAARSAGAPARADGRRRRPARSGNPGRLRAAVRARKGDRHASERAVASLVRSGLCRQTDQKAGQGRQADPVPITSTVREKLWPLQGHHPEHVFTYVAVRTHRGWVKGPALSDHAGRAAGALAPAVQGCWRHCLPLP